VVVAQFCLAALRQRQAIVHG